MRLETRWTIDLQARRKNTKISKEKYRKRFNLRWRMSLSSTISNTSKTNFSLPTNKSTTMKVAIWVMLFSHALTQISSSTLFTIIDWASTRITFQRQFSCWPDISNPKTQNTRWERETTLELKTDECRSWWEGCRKPWKKCLPNRKSKFCMP